MRYGTWKILFSENPEKGGTVPDALSGLFFVNKTQTQLAGYLPDELDISTLSDWSVTEITESEFQDLVLKANPEGKVIDGLAVFPKFSIK